LKKSVTIELSAPPSRRNLSGQDRAAFRSWLDGAGRQILTRALSAIPGNVAIKMLVGLPSEPSDLDHVARPIINLLETHEVIAEDAVSDLALRWDRTVQKGRVLVQVREARAPHCRLSARARARISEVQRARWAAARAKKCSNEEIHHGAQNDGPGHDDAQSHQEHRARQADQNITLARTRVDALE
jgi:hypothetical protein